MPGKLAYACGYQDLGLISNPRGCSRLDGYAIDLRDADWPGL
jgi:hypothetical protein